MRLDWLENIMLCLWLAAMLLLMAGCKTVQPVVLTQNRETTKDSIKTEYKHDSIYIDRWHTQYIKGDTIIIRDSVFVDRWHKMQQHDSIYIHTTDSIPHPVEVERIVEVTKESSPFLKRSGIALWIIIALFVVGVVVGIILKIKK